MPRKLFLLIIIFYGSISAKAQLIDNVSSLRAFGNENEIRLFYENDFFSAQDQYYSQGINLEYISPVLHKNPVNYFLVRLNSTKRLYGFSIEHNVFTPSSIRHDEILYHDHPFSACFLLKSFLRTQNESENTTVSSALSLGFIGPLAFGKQMQTGIHTWLNNLLPLGWDHQIRNDFVLNYQINYERNIYHLRDIINFSYCGGLNAGTLYDNLNSGLQFKIGKFNKHSQKSKYEIFLFAKSCASYSFYNATLRGGVFNRINEYVLEENEIEPLLLQNTIGINIRLNKMRVEYFQSVITKEFEAGTTHRYGGISLGYILE